jgi:uncharacterized protein YjbK
MSKVINIQKANYIDDYKIYFEFDDGKKTTVDFQPFIFSSSHPDIKKYQDQELFKKFNLDYGEIEWNDYELAFPIYDLYKGKI